MKEMNEGKITNITAGNRRHRTCSRQKLATTERRGKVDSTPLGEDARCLRHAMATFPVRAPKAGASVRKLKFHKKKTRARNGLSIEFR